MSEFGCHDDVDCLVIAIEYVTLRIWHHKVWSSSIDFTTFLVVCFTIGLQGLRLGSGTCWGKKG